MKISMIGLGKLGMPCAEVMSTKHTVFGYDPNVTEASFRLANSIHECISGADIVFVAVPTPHSAAYGGETPTSQLESKDFDYSIVKSVLHEIALNRRPHQLIVLISTVLPGTVRRELAPIIRDLIYNPYLIAVGTVAKDFLDPEMIMIGCNTKDCPDIKHLQSFYNTMVTGPVRYETGTWEDAEAMKIFYNTFISWKVSFANMIMDVGDRIGHMDVDLVTGALSRSTKRIMSSMYMKPGLGDGGACHPRDNIALRWLSEELDLGYDMFGTVMEIRERQAENLARRLCAYGLPVVILGKGYKKNLPNTDGSYSLLVGHYVEQMGYSLTYYDPLLSETPKITEPSTYLISYWHDWLEDMQYAEGSIIVDPWRSSTKIENCRVVALGNKG